jgi:hypothetical protein
MDYLKKLWLRRRQALLASKSDHQGERFFLGHARRKLPKPVKQIARPAKKIATLIKKIG